VTCCLIWTENYLHVVKLMDILYIVCCHYVVDDSVPSWAIVDVLRVNYDLTKRYFIMRSLFVCLLVHMFILIDIFML